MNIKISKPYWIVGTLLTTGVIIVTGYNIIVANTNETIPTGSSYEQTQEYIDYSKDISELKQKLTDIESRVGTLEEQVSSLETKDEEKGKDITSLKTKDTNLQTSINNIKNNTKFNEISTLSKDVKELKTQIKKILSTINEENPIPTKTTTLKIQNLRKGHIKIEIGANMIYDNVIKENKKDLILKVSGEGNKKIEIHIVDEGLTLKGEIDFNKEENIIKINE